MIKSDLVQKPSTSRSPKGERRREKLIEVATQQFLQNGYSRTSLASIIQVAGGSLATLYENFGDKRGLFFAVIQRYIHQMSQRMQPEPHPEPHPEHRPSPQNMATETCPRNERRPTDVVGDERECMCKGEKSVSVNTAQKPPMQVLEEMVDRGIRLISTSQSQSMFRLIVSERELLSDLTDQFLREANQQIIQILGGTLRHLQMAGFIHLKLPADQIAMVQARLMRGLAVEWMIQKQPDAAHAEIARSEAVQTIVDVLRNLVEPVEEKTNAPRRRKI